MGYLSGVNNRKAVQKRTVYVRFWTAFCNVYYNQCDCRRANRIIGITILNALMLAL